MHKICIKYAQYAKPICIICKKYAKKKCKKYAGKLRKCTRNVQIDMSNMQIIFKNDTQYVNNVHNMQKICKNVHNMQKYSQNMQNKIYTKHAKICKKYAKKHAKNMQKTMHNMQEICKNMLNTERKNMHNMQNKYAKNLRLPAAGGPSQYAALSKYKICKQHAKICKNAVYANYVTNMQNMHPRLC